MRLRRAADADPAAMYLGDWSRAPNFLFPPLMSAYGNPVRNSSFQPATSKKDDIPFK